MALEQISAEAWASLTPYLRVVPPGLRRRRDDDPRPDEIARLARVTGERIVYLDAAGSPRRSPRLAPLGITYVRDVYEVAVASNLAFVPVYPFRRPDLVDTVASFASDFGAGVLVTADSALTLGTGRLYAEIRDEVRTFGVEPSRLDALVDLGYIPPGSSEAGSAVWLLQQVMAAAPWRSVVLVGTSIPDSVASEVPSGSLGGIERRELGLYQAVQAKVGPGLRFGDYAVQHPVPPTPAPVPKMHASIRYTAGPFTYVSRGERPLGTVPRDDRPGEYREVAERLLALPPFMGLDCCWGDKFVEDLASGRTTARSQYWMRAVATCHHLTVVAAERAGTTPGTTRPTQRGRARRPVEVTAR